MAQLHFEVDTSPMARTVESVKGHVNGVTAAVTVMEAAVIAAERESSRTICENVDNGFYVMVKSQISQKAIAAYTEMTSKQGILLQLAKALDNVKQQMLADFNMISRRYFKLFQSLNKALETRIKELDRPAIKMAEIKKSLVYDRLKDNSSTALSAANETTAVMQTALSGKLKVKTRDAIETLYSSAMESKSYNDKLAGILIKESSETDTGKNAGSPLDSSKNDYRFLPVIFCSTESLLNGTELIETIHTAQTDSWQSAAPIINEVNRRGNSLPWIRVSEEEKSLVKGEFVSLCERDASDTGNTGTGNTIDERLAHEIFRLFDESSWEVLKNEL
ncbi:MAG: hypothetical protein LBP76_04640 [Treponema sp.]|jgi:hypothetical protein|nr:hypothetical protein [Treponema sp.]